MKHLKISPDLSLPLDAVTQTFAVLAKRRVGKSYTASVMAEEMCQANIPFVVLDPTGAWWGLRASADGKSEGYPVTIIGGAHGDVPLEPTAGKVIAELVVDHPGFYIIDLSLTASNAEQDRFVTDFAERLYRKKEGSRAPLHLFIDEADSFCPQRPMPGQQRMLGAFEALVRRGGIRGIGVTLISQRAAVINKNVLTQTEILVALQTTAPQDQDAIDEWIKRNGTEEQRRVFMASLASLGMGEAWVWSPAWLQVFKKVKIRQRTTFNSSATPKVGEQVTMPTQLAKVDLDKLGDEIKKTVERQKENDPALLRKQIAELKKAKPVAAEVKEVPMLTKQEEQAIKDLTEKFNEVGEYVREITGFMEGFKLIMQAIGQKRWPTPKSHPFNMPKQVRTDLQAQRQLISNPRPVNTGLSKCERAILTALYQRARPLTVGQCAILSGYSSGSGGFNNSLSALRSLELITRTQPISITEEGIKLVGEADPLPTGQELIRYWMGKLSKCERAILEVVTQYPNGVTIGELAEGTGYAASSGGFNNSLSKLRTLELIERGQPVKASEVFFQ